jgi:acyl transferase domain-containing protein/NAD(P)H-dependent flavin oxidoreductase YrpB (nitropropane dioxygenase family)/NAD(P)-dependent dehydrogenase (short-subunit alcohol dehydrogenase family)
MSDFDVIGLTLPCLLDPRVAIAVSRAGGVGVLDLQWGGPEIWSERSQASAPSAVEALGRFAKGRWGVKLDGEDESGCEGLIVSLRSCVATTNFDLAILTDAPPDVLSRQIARLRSGLIRPKRILLEVIRAGEGIERPGVDGFIAKGNEAGGLVGEETSFVLIQRLSRLTSMPVMVHGGIGLHSAAACRCSGANGIVLDAQLCLTRESPISVSARGLITRMDGSETTTIGDGIGFPFRAYQRPGLEINGQLHAEAEALQESSAGGSTTRLGLWKRAIQSRVGWGDPGTSVWPLGQDIAVAAGLTERFKTAGGIVNALRQSVDANLTAARTQKPLAEGSALARSHGTRFPIVQGPMTRVSDNAAFTLEVAKAGGLPFISLALSNATETRKLLQETRIMLDKRPWGVGILGFVPLAIRTPQLEVIRELKPAFSLIAGGRPDQAFQLEREGIATYLHVPSPDLLKLFFEQGARRFVFEGRECGGHVGPRSSFVLWDAMTDALCSLYANGADLSEVHVLFAGGVHDSLSAAMVAALSAPLAEMGAKTGVLMGTAYLFAREAVTTGAIKPTFQAEAIRCQTTSLLETGPGHASRCARTPFVEQFEAERRRMAAAGASRDEMRNALEDLNLGRLRLAAKGVTRRTCVRSGTHTLVEATCDEQQTGGMYMLGQLAALRCETCSIEELHRDVAIGGSDRLDQISVSNIAESPDRPCDVAIIGVATLLPRAPDARTFWENVLAKVDAITEIPQHRFDWRLYYDPDPAKRDKIYSKWGGFLDDVPFDPARYGIPPTAMLSIEPMQLLTLEAVRAAIEDAGYADRTFARSRTSVILGAGGGLADLGQQYGLRSGLPMFLDGTMQNDEISEAIRASLPEWTEDSFAGLLLNVAAGRVANRFDLGGVNFTVDAACASSLAAVYLAVRELESKSSDVVITGGVDTVQNPFGYLCFSKTRALSPHGRCRPFDAAADGIVISEGLAMLVLKRLADAERDGDRIYAVIKSVAGSSDGRDKGLTAPRPDGQVVALKRAYEIAGVSPATVGLIEAHGTGTVAGDAAEVEALKKVFAGGPRQSCAIGSVKSMIGHTKCTAGVAGLVKAAMALHDKVLPPTLNVDSPNPRANFPASPFFVNTEARPWLARGDGEPRRAGVSAFGFGGTNFHVLLEEYAEDPASEKHHLIARRWPSEMFVWSADSASSLRTIIAELTRALDGGSQPALVDLAAATSRAARKPCESPAGNTCGKVALVVVSTSLSDLRSKLSIVESRLAEPTFQELADPRGIYFGSQARRPVQGKTAFLFPGQGSQHVNMLAELAIYFHEVRQCFESADRTLAERIPERLSRYIFPPSQFTPEDESRCRQSLSRTEITQPAMGAACIAMWKLLGSLGLKPGMVAGHSYGEYVALAVAGVISESTLYELSEARGRCFVDSAQTDSADTGAMLAVFETAERVSEILGGIAGVWISNVNSPRQTAVSGTAEGLAAALHRLRLSAVEATSIPVSCGFHSPLMSKAKGRFVEQLAAITFSPFKLPVYSNTTAAPYPRDSNDVAALLSEHLVKPVRFKEEIEAMFEAGARIFVEVGPRAVLTGLVGQILGEREHVAVSTGGSLAPLTQLQHALARLIVEGVPIALDRLFDGRVEREPQLSSPDLPTGTWLVSGGRARRLGEPAVRPPAHARIKDFQTPEIPASEAPAIPGVSAAPFDATNEVMVRFQKTMSHFLETQRQTLMAYLAASNNAERKAPKTPAEAPVSWPVPDAPIPVSATIAPASTHERLLEIISDRTGYPCEMLKSTLNLEADLGIDSIKRVEILGVFQRDCLPDEQEKLRGSMEELTSLTTIGSIVDSLNALLNGTPVSPAGKHQAAAASKPILPLPRFVPTAVECGAAPPGPPALPAGVVLITDDGRGVAIALASLLKNAGWPVSVSQTDLSEESEVKKLVETLLHAHPKIAAIVHLLPLKEEGFPATAASCERRIASECKGLFHLAKAGGGALRVSGQRAPILLAATCLGGDFGVTAVDSAAPSPIHGGVAGIVKTLNHEWPEVSSKVIDFEPGVPPSIAAQRLFAELSSGRGESPIEIGYQGERRVEIRIAPATLATAPPASTSQPAPFHGQPVILITGGARGITANVTLALTSHHQARLIIVGRSPLPQEHESPATAGIDSVRELKSILIDELSRDGLDPEPAAVEAAYRRLLCEREMRTNLRTMRENGSDIQYKQCDLADADNFAQLIDEIYSLYGGIDGVIHGAGLIEDRLVENKDSASFDRVIGAKVNGALALARKLRFQSLRFFVLFSSVSGRFGNRGQVDYAAANEILNKLAAHLDARWPCRVVAVNWGPWDGSNMVGPVVREQFLRQGVQLIEPAAGCEAFLRELCSGSKGNPEVILGAGPWCAIDHSATKLATLRTPSAVPHLPFLGTAPLILASGGAIQIEALLDPSRHLFLNDHRIDGKPVLPAAMAVEVMTEVARKGWSDWVVTGIKSVRVCKGVVLERIPMRLSISAKPQTHYNVEDAGLEVEVEIRDPANSHIVYYRGTVCLADRIPEAFASIGQNQNGNAVSPLTAAEAYRDRLFHGPSLQCLTLIHSLAEDSIHASVRRSCPSDCLRDTQAESWIVDPVLLDAGPQLAILWAQKFRGLTVLPSRIGEVQIHQMMTTEAALECRLVIDHSINDPAVVASFEVFGPDNRLVMSVRGLELVGSKSLNRLAVVGSAFDAAGSCW